MDEKSGDYLYKIFIEFEYDFQFSKKSHLDKRILTMVLNETSSYTAFHYCEEVYTKVVVPMTANLKSLMNYYFVFKEAELFQDCLKFRINNGLRELEIIDDE